MVYFQGTETGSSQVGKSSSHWISNFLELILIFLKFLMNYLRNETDLKFSFLPKTLFVKLIRSPQEAEA